MKKIVLVMMLLPAVILSAVERDIVLGGGAWQADVLENLEINSSRAGENSLELRDGEYVPDKSTVLLLHFNSAKLTDASGTFTVSQNKSSLSSGMKKYGPGAAIFNGEKDTIVLDRNGAGIFPGKIYSGDFSVEFWVYGRNYSDGETVLQFESYTSRGESFLPQFFKCYFEERKITWHIRNFFLPPGESSFEFKLAGTTRLVPGKWSHHMVRYEASTGLMEYLVDGIPEAVAYVNSDARETGEYYPFYSGEKGRIIIGDKFTGLLDEMRIKVERVMDYTLSKYRNQAGYYISEPIDLGHSKSSVFGIETRQATPPGTDVRYYYFIDDIKKRPGPFSPEWKSFNPGFFSAAGGRFLRIKAELYSDGRGDASPSLASVRIRYDHKNPPPPPQVVRAEAGNGSVRLRWSETADPDIDGYHVYFGKVPGRYFGTTGSGQGSPLDAGKSNTLIIDQLENGIMYYFSVAAYCNTATPYGNGIISEGGRYSGEVSARPLSQYGELK